MICFANRVHFNSPLLKKRSIPACLAFRLFSMITSMTSFLMQTVAPLKSFFKSCIQLSKSRQKLDVILENKVVQKLKFSENVNNKKHAPKIIFFNEKKIGKIRIIFDFESQRLALFDRLI